MPQQIHEDSFAALTIDRAAKPKTGFASLPRELRDRIYEYVSVGLEPLAVSVMVRTYPTSHHTPPWISDAKLPRMDSPLPSLAAVIRDEFFQIHFRKVNLSIRLTRIPELYLGSDTQPAGGIKLCLNLNDKSLESAYMLFVDEDSNDIYFAQEFQKQRDDITLAQAFQTVRESNVQVDQISLGIDSDLTAQPLGKREWANSYVSGHTKASLNALSSLVTTMPKLRTLNIDLGTPYEYSYRNPHRPRSDRNPIREYRQYRLKCSVVSGTVYTCGFYLRQWFQNFDTGAKPFGYHEVSRNALVMGHPFRLEGQELLKLPKGVLEGFFVWAPLARDREDCWKCDRLMVHEECDAAHY